MTRLDQPPAKRALFTTIADGVGGAERVTMSLAARLASDPGWDVEVFVVCAQMPQSFTRENLPPEVRVRYGPWSNYYFSFLVSPLRLAGERYDLVFSSFVYLNGLISVLRRLGLMKIGRLVIRESMSIFDRFGGLKARVFSRIYRFYGGEDLLIVQTQYMADHVAPRLPARSAAHIRVLANPIDVAAIETARREPLEPELQRRLAGRANILFCGRFVGFKRPELALEAFHQIAAKHETSQLVFMGSGPLEKQVQDEAARLRLADRILFLGRRINPFPVMAACQYGLLTSANEGFPNVVLEMMACGVRKVIATPCADGLAELPGLALTAAHSAEEIVGALDEAIRSGEDNRALYAETVAARSVEAFLDRVVNG